MIFGKTWEEKRKTKFQLDVEKCEELNKWKIVFAFWPTKLDDGRWVLWEFYQKKTPAYMHHQQLNTLDDQKRAFDRFLC
jgi:hypothetical protein